MARRLTGQVMVIEAPDVDLRRTARPPPTKPSRGWLRVVVRKPRLVLFEYRATRNKVTATPRSYVRGCYNGITGGLAHEINARMPVYAPFLRDHAPHTTLWHEPLEEDNVGSGAVHEVTCGSYKHITRSSQRRLSISRLRGKDGPLLATFSRGAIGRARSDRVSPLTTKIVHGNLPTDARLELWAGAESGSVICACGEPLKWSSRAEVGRLQWHMLRCTLLHEAKVRREWHSAVRRTPESSTDNARVINAATACRSTSDRGVIHTAVEDESSGWQAPTTRLVGNHGKWEFTDGIPPTFDRGEHWEEDSDDGDVTDLTDETTDVVTAAAVSDAAARKKVRTATGDAE